MQQERRSQILQAARRVAAREGFHGATIQKIASEAGLKSPSLVYWYFRGKRELLQAMMEDISPLLKGIPGLWNRMDDPPEEVLFYIGRAYLGTFETEEARQLLRIFFSEVTSSPEVAGGFGERAALLLNFIIAYQVLNLTVNRLCSRYLFHLAGVNRTVCNLDRSIIGRKR